MPLRLRNAPTALMKGLDYGKGYRYAHDEAAPSLPASATGPTTWTRRRFYEPAPRGLEISIGERLAELRRLNEEAKRSST